MRARRERIDEDGCHTGSTGHKDKTLPGLQAQQSLRSFKEHSAHDQARFNALRKRRTEGFQSAANV